jgi:hypothetical protein
VTSLLSLLTDPAVVRATTIAFAAMVALTVVHHVAVYTIPLKIVRLTALPWAFRIDHNLDLDFQTVTYAAVHDRRIARFSHLTLPLEQVAWVIILLSVHPAVLVAMLALVTCQALLLGEKPLGFGLIAMWAVLSALGALALHVVGPAALVASFLLLLVGPVLRFIGHAFEPIPPFVGDPKEGPPRDEFLPLSRTRLGPTLPFLVLGGLVSEFAAALPHRLIVVQFFWFAQQVGYAPRKASAWAQARVTGAAIRAHGWKAYDKTRRLFAPDAPTAAAMVVDV